MTCKITKIRYKNVPLISILQISVCCTQILRNNFSSAPSETNTEVDFNPNIKLKKSN